MDMPTDLYELYAEFGIAAEKAQVLEMEAGNVALGFITIFVDSDKVTPEETEMFRAVVDDLNRKTFGWLLSRIKKTMSLSDSIVDTVDEALASRNHLTHHFFRRHNFAIHSEEGRALMMIELKGIEAKLDLAHQTLSAMSDILLQIAGRSVDKELLEKFVIRGKKINL